MSTWPSISIVTPSYNQAHFLGATIESILSQDYPNLEYIVIDGGSTDGSVDILRTYGNRIRWVSEPDRGQTDAINKGLRQTSGEIVAYLNSDDVLEPGALHRVVRTFQDHPDARWLTGQCRIINEHGQPIRSFIRSYKSFWLKRYSRGKLFVTNFIAQPATFWRRSVHDEIGYFDESLRYVMDYDFWLRLSALGDPLIVPHPLAAFRIHAASKGESQYYKQFAEDAEVVSRYAQQRGQLALHRLHNQGIVFAYQLLK
ncbi:glycosyltransferase [Candidatus Berkelbacteria bacterium]|nr:glycosyltransferase [Candidatus Berkelbacteria bacterium]